MSVLAKIKELIHELFSGHVPKWARAFDDDRDNLEAARIKAISRGVSETGSSTVMAIVETESVF